MPYADPEKARAAKRASYQKRLETEAGFREREKARAAQWLKENPERNVANVRACRMRKLLGI